MVQFMRMHGMSIHPPTQPASRPSVSPSIPCFIIIIVSIIIVIVAVIIAVIIFITTIIMIIAHPPFDLLGLCNKASLPLDPKAAGKGNRAVYWLSV